MIRIPQTNLPSTKTPSSSTCRAHQAYWPSTPSLVKLFISCPAFLLKHHLGAAGVLCAIPCEGELARGGGGAAEEWHDLVIREVQGGHCISKWISQLENRDMNVLVKSKETIAQRRLIELDSLSGFDQRGAEFGKWGAVKKRSHLIFWPGTSAFSTYL